MRPRPRITREEGRVASAWFVSIVGHVTALGLGGLLVAASLGRRAPPPRPIAPPPPRDETVEIELPTVVDGSGLIAAPPAETLPPEALARGGGEATPRLDTGERGRGGEDTSLAPAINLADRDDGMLLSPDVMSRLDRTQIQRIRASKRRASREDWRASREPMELTFLAEGKRGTRPERHAFAKADPSSGGRASGAVQKQGSALGAAELPPGVGERTRPIGGPVEGASRASSGLGARDGVPGEDHRDAMLVALARPMVAQSTPSVPADVRDRPTDNVDSEQEVATRIQSILHASNAGGARGSGNGGERGGGPAGAGGVSGPGSNAHALGSSAGPGLDVDPRDRRRSEYVRQVLAKIDPHTRWRQVVPSAAALDGSQGVVIITITIRADGAASASITRASGIPELDENCRRAVLKAGPFPPVPAELGQTFRLAVPLDFTNPTVRPRSPKPQD